MKLIKFESQPSDMVDVKYVVELASMDRQVEPSCYMTISAVALLDKSCDASDVLVSALKGVDVATGAYAVRLTVDGIEWLKFILVAGDMAIELATPEFVVLQDKPNIDVQYIDVQEVFSVHLCNMGTGVSKLTQGYVTIDKAARSVALSSGITRDLNDGIYCARTYTRIGGHLAFFRKQNDTVEYLHIPAFIKHKGY